MAILAGIVAVWRSPVKCLEDAIEASAISCSIFGMFTMLISILSFAIVGTVGVSSPDLMTIIFNTVPFILRLSPIIMAVMVFPGIVAGSIYGVIVRRLKPRGINQSAGSN